MPLVDVAEKRLTVSQNYRVNNQTKLIDQVLVQKTCDEGCPADYVRVLPRLPLRVRISAMSRMIRAVGGHEMLSSVVDTTTWGVLAANRA